MIVHLAARYRCVPVTSNVRRQRANMSALHLSRAVAVAVAATFMCLAAKPQPQDSVSATAWMTGCWSVEGKETGTGEAWLAPAGGSMLGVGRTVRSGKTVDHEFMQIRVGPAGKLVFIAMPAGKPEATFVATATGLEDVSFENPNHDFPQKISYRKTGESTMVARIEGTRNGVARSITFPMRRSSCELSK